MSGTTADSGRLREAFGQPESRFDWYDADDRGHDPAVGWDLAFGCQVSFGYEDDVLKAVVAMSDGSGSGHEVREVWPTQVREFGQRLIALAYRGEERERTLAQVVEASMADIVPRRGSTIPEVISAVVAAVVAHEAARAEHDAATATAAADAVTEIATDRARVREQRDRALDLAEAALGAKGVYDRPRLLEELARLRRVVAGSVDTETGTDPEHPEEGR